MAVWREQAEGLAKLQASFDTRQMLAAVDDLDRFCAQRKSELRGDCAAICCGSTSDETFSRTSGVDRQSAFSSHIMTISCTMPCNTVGMGLRMAAPYQYS